MEGSKKHPRGPEQAKQTPRHRAEKARAGWRQEKAFAALIRGLDTLPTIPPSSSRPESCRELMLVSADQTCAPSAPPLRKKTNVVGSPRKSLVPFAFAIARRREKGETRPSSRHLQRAQVEGTKKRSRGPEQAKQTPRHRAEKAHANEASGRQTEGSVL